VTRKEIDAFIIAHLLKRIPISAVEQEHFCSLMTVRKVWPRQYLLQEGDVCKYEFFVVKGFLRSFFMDDKGNQHTLNFAMEDWWISDTKSFLGEIPSSINIIAQELSIVLQIDKKSIDQLYKDFPVFERFWRILNQNFNIAQNERLLNAISMDGAQRYRAMCKKYPAIENRMPQKHIASYLGITPVFLSMIRRNS